MIEAVAAAATVFALAGAWLLGEHAWAARRRRQLEEPDEESRAHLRAMRDLSERVARARANLLEREALEVERGEEWRG